MRHKNSWMVRKAGLLFLLASVVISFTPFLFTQFQVIEGLNFDNTGAIGDTIGGITAPFINMFAAFLVYLALKEQVKANQIQIDSLNATNERLENERIIIKNLDNN